jgi:hypothetical protein
MNTKKKLKKIINANLVKNTEENSENMIKELTYSLARR